MDGVSPHRRDFGMEMRHSSISKVVPSLFCRRADLRHILEATNIHWGSATAEVDAVEVDYLRFNFSGALPAYCRS